MTRISVSLAALMLLVSSSVSQAASPMCQITFKIGTGTSMFSASVFVVYTNAPGHFPGEGDAVDCQTLNNTTGSSGDSDMVRTLGLNAVGTPTPIQGPKDFMRCSWEPTSRFPVQGDFDLSSQSGTSTSFQPVNPQITISKIECSGDVTTTTSTTSSTTSTTLEPPKMCGDFDGNGKIQTSDALAVLRAGVGQLVCLLCLCDVDGNGSNGASDALAVLRKAVGLSVIFNCAICE